MKYEYKFFYGSMKVLVIRAFHCPVQIRDEIEVIANNNQRIPLYVHKIEFGPSDSVEILLCR